MCCQQSRGIEEGNIGNISATHHFVSLEMETFWRGSEGATAGSRPPSDGVVGGNRSYDYLLQRTSELFGRGMVLGISCIPRNDFDILTF